MSIVLPDNRSSAPLSRRSVLLGLATSSLSTPAIVRVSSIMPVRGVSITETNRPWAGYVERLCYNSLRGQLVQLSCDDVPEGGSDPLGPRRSHALTQAMGGTSFPVPVEPHVSVDPPLAPEETLLLCSDGLTDMVINDFMTRIGSFAKPIVIGLTALPCPGSQAIHCSIRLMSFDACDSPHRRRAVLRPSECQILQLTSMFGNRSMAFAFAAMVTSP